MNDHLIFTDNGIIQQDFDLPPPLILYICNNPIASSEFLYKIYSACKYFYPKMKILPCKSMTVMHFETMMSLSSPLSKIFDGGKQFFYQVKFPKPKIYSLNFKLCCVQTSFLLWVKEEEDPKLISYLFAKVIWHCRNSCFCISGQILSLDEYKVLAEAASHNLTMRDVTIKNPNGTFVPVEELLRIGINIKNFSFSSNRNHHNYYTTETAQKISILSRPRKFVHFTLEDLPANFDAQSVSMFIRNNCDLPYSNITLQFNKHAPRKPIYAFFRYLKTDLQKDKTFENIKLNGSRLKEFYLTFY